MAGKGRPASKAKPPSLYQSRDYTRECAGNAGGSDPQEPHRSDFRRDFARLIHSASFRRLSGKTQLFPSFESDFFRNRLTHSLEVAQVAKSIAIRLNAEYAFFKKHGRIDTDLVEIAGMAHDLGHPPFGHNGELVLDECMRRFGGFEGNAQTLRILSRLEKKRTTDPHLGGITASGRDLRCGLDLCARTLAAVLKYDASIPLRRPPRATWRVSKGYYASESALVAGIKRAVVGSAVRPGTFKTIECSIMDLADDISYSTYDLEDSFKGGFLTPLDVIAADDELLQSVAASVRKRAADDAVAKYVGITGPQVRGVLISEFEEIVDDGYLQQQAKRNKAITRRDVIEWLLGRHQDSELMAKSGYARTSFTSTLVGEFIAGVRFVPNPIHPSLSSVRFDDRTWLRVEVLKRLTYAAQIMSPRLKVPELRGREIVRELFETLSSDSGHELMPDDFRVWYRSARRKADRMRIVCDFVAGMTDRYAVEFYARLNSETPQTIFKPI